MEHTGLVLEGGGMRGVYTAGALECFMDYGIQFPYIVAVSAGACNAASYIAKQKGRNRKVTIDYIDHPQYISFWNLFRERSLFGMRLLFEEIPDRLVPFDYETFYDNPAQFWVGVTDAVTGGPVFVEKRSALGDRNMMTVVRASSSLPFISPPISHKGHVWFDGGISAPIPLTKSIADGNRRHVVVLTQVKGYEKKPFRQRWLARTVYPRYPGITKALEGRYQIYNDTLDLVERMEQEGSLVAIRPSSDLGVGRMTKDKGKLTALYELGYKDTEKVLGKL